MTCKRSAAYHTLSTPRLRKGINIEPVPFFFDRISSDRPRDINLNCVASDRDDQTLNLCVSEGTGLSTLEVERQEALKRNPERAVQLIEVQSQTLNSIFSTHAKRHIDFLKIDVEGHELAVLRGLDLTIHHPRVIVIETTLPSLHPGGRVPMQERQKLPRILRPSINWSRPRAIARSISMG